MPESYPVSARLMYVPDGVQNSLRVSCMRKLGMDLFIYLFFLHHILRQFCSIHLHLDRRVVPHRFLLLYDLQRVVLCSTTTEYI